MTSKKNCKTCLKELTKDIIVKRVGYIRSDCRLCLNKKSREIGRKKAELKRKHRIW